MEGDKAGGGGEWGDEVDKAAEPENALGTLKVKPSVRLNVQFIVKGSPSPLRPKATPNDQPINVSLEYSPDDLEVSISAHLLNREEGLSSGGSPQVLERSGRREIRQSIGTDADQIFNIPIESGSMNMKYRGRAAAAPDQLLKQSSMHRIFKREDSSDEELTWKEGENSIYQSVLMGNDSLFGDISMINNAATSDNMDTVEMSSVLANAGSMDDSRALGYDVTDLSDNKRERQIYPGLNDTDEMLEKKLANQDAEYQGDEFTPPEIFSKGSDGLRNELLPENFEPNKTEGEYDDDVVSIISDLLDKVESISEVGKEAEEDGIPLEGRTSVKLTTAVPMKSKKFVFSVPVRVNDTKGDSRGRKEMPFLGTMEQTKRLKIHSAVFKASEPVQATQVVDINKKLNWVSEPCTHGVTPHACHVCIPIPEEAVLMLEDSIGLTSTEARKAAFTFLRFLREQQNTNRVKTLMKYVSGVDVVKKRSRRRINLPVAHTKEQKLKAAIQSVSRQKGAWGIFEDEEVVISHFKELNKHLTTFDKNSVRQTLKEDRYDSVRALGLYFALEKRWTVRSEILSTLNLLITKDSTAFEVLVMSDLPVDLANSIRQEYLGNEAGQERILGYGTVLLSLLYSGYPMQVDHLERINADFVYCLLQITEGNMNDGCSATLKDTAVKIILAYNLQFGLDELYTNKLVAALSAFKDPDFLKNKMLLLLLNQGASQLQNKKQRFASPACFMVVKLATDILSCRKTTDFFMDSDLNIILAGVGSYVTELEPGDEKRTAALRLARLILRRLDYQHNGIRRVIQILKGIFMEKEPESRRDQKIARKIAKEIDESASRSRSQLTSV